jgi:hypothetical protein
MNQEHPIMASQWYCRIMGEEWGPMSARDLLAVARRGRLMRDDVVRRGEDGTWVRAEIVDGLFNTPAPASTITSHRVAIARRTATPAKRSVGAGRGTQYWISDGRTTVGPVSALRLRQLAQQGALRPTDLIRSNRSRWVRAARVKGLEFWDASPETPTIVNRELVQPLGQASPLPSSSPIAPATDNADAPFGDLVLS